MAEDPGHDPGDGRLIPPADALPPDFAAALDARAPRLAGFAERILWFERVTSTNDLAARAAAAGAAHGTVVAADFQERGRGRMGRVWFSPPGAGLYLSVVVSPASLLGTAPTGSVALAASLTMTAGVAVADALRAVTGLPVDIKWPNDVVISRRKLCGILAEGVAGSGGLQHIVLGIGINVLPAAYPPDIASRATSLEAETGRGIDRAAVFAETLACLADRLRGLASGQFPAILERWRELSPGSRGARVEVVDGQSWVPAVTAGVDHDGALLVEAGSPPGVRRVIAGEVRWL